MVLGKHLFAFTTFSLDYSFSSIFHLSTQLFHTYV